MNDKNLLGQFEIIHDGILGVDTKIRNLAASVSSDKVNWSYEPTPYKALMDIFKKYPYEKDDVFADIGCGLGRVLCVAALAGYQEIYGIEKDSRLLEECERNINKICDTFHINIKLNLENQLFLGDGRENRYTKVFLFNPFHLKLYIRMIQSYHHSKGIRYIFLYDPPPEYIAYMNRVKGFVLHDVINTTDVERSVKKTYIYKRDNRHTS